MLLFGIYLVTALFVDYPKEVQIIILSVYFLYAVMRVIYYMKQSGKWRKITNKTVAPGTVLCAARIRSVCNDSVGISNLGLAVVSFALSAGEGKRTINRNVTIQPI